MDTQLLFGIIAYLCIAIIMGQDIANRGETFTIPPKHGEGAVKIPSVREENKRKVEYCSTWKFTVKTGAHPYAGSVPEDNVYLIIYDIDYVATKKLLLDKDFDKSSTLYTIDPLVTEPLDDVVKIQISKDGKNGLQIEWAELICKTNKKTWKFLVNAWLDDEEDIGGLLERELFPEDQSEKECTTWEFSVKTGCDPTARTEDNVYLIIYGKCNAVSKKIQLEKVFETATLYTFDPLMTKPIHDVIKIHMSKDGKNGLQIEWAELTCKTNDKTWKFMVNGWLDEQAEGGLSREREFFPEG